MTQGQRGVRGCPAAHVPRPRRCRARSCRAWLPGCLPASGAQGPAPAPLAHTHPAPCPHPLVPGSRLPLHGFQRRLQGHGERMGARGARGGGAQSSAECAPPRPISHSVRVPAPQTSLPSVTVGDTMYVPGQSASLLKEASAFHARAVCVRGGATGAARVLPRTTPIHAHAPAQTSRPPSHPSHPHPHPSTPAYSTPSTATPAPAPPPLTTL